MRAVNLPNWLELLEADVNLGAAERASYTITIRWFLGHCKRVGRRATAAEARLFVEAMTQAKRAKPWVVERWKDGLRWFFLEAKRLREAAGAEAVSLAEGAKSLASSGKALAKNSEQVISASSEQVGRPAIPGQARSTSSGQARSTCVEGQAASPCQGTRGPVAQTARLEYSEPKWKLQFIRGVRIRQFSYQTEKAYLN
jgi:hypothetical protein